MEGLGACLTGQPASRRRTGQRASQVRKMREHDQACSPAGRALGSGAGCPPRQPVPPGAGRGRRRVGLGGLWLLLVPVACCGGPLLVAGLAAASALAWGALGLALSALLVGAMTVNRPRCRARAASAPTVSPRRPSQRADSAGQVVSATAGMAS